ncbi:MAG: hypothetical protein J0H57_06290, partial [Rhodospirillales bacterium]|nr:hypothetical protein [Rhodospirillales bacterium]
MVTARVYHEQRRKARIGSPGQARIGTARPDPIAAPEEAQPEIRVLRHVPGVPAADVAQRLDA